MPAPKRSVNLYDTLQRWVKTWKPDCAFDGKTRADFDAWKKRFRLRYRRCLGPWPERVPLRTKVLSSADRGDHVRKKIVFDSSPGVTVPAYLLVPKGLRKGERRPGLLAAHGHGNGKDDICGVTREEGKDKAAIDIIERLNYEYGLDAVRRGYVVIAPAPSANVALMRSGPARPAATHATSSTWRGSTSAGRSSRRASGTDAGRWTRSRRTRTWTRSASPSSA